MPNNKLNINDKGRLIEQKSTEKKTKYNVSSYYYTNIDISAKSIPIADGDGSVKTVTKSQIIHVNKTLKIKVAKSIRGNLSRGSIVEILK
jgi:hypothetical protein